jgi:hypothetical protein
LLSRTEEDKEGCLEYGEIGGAEKIKASLPSAMF